GKTISNDVVHDERVHDRDWAAEHGLQAFAGFPIQVEDRVVGVMAMFSKTKLPGHLLTTLELLADLTASTLENVRHFRLEAELARARKLESVGQLAAGVAHEINSPMQFISDNIEFIDECTTKLFALLDGYDRAMGDMEHPVGWEARQREIANLIHDGQLEYIRDEMPQAVAESRQGIRRVLDIVRAMRQFSHPGTKEMVDTDLNEAVQNALIISKNRWKNVADVETALDPELAHVPALITEIGQVFLNLVVNAADAISDQIGPEPDAKGRILIRSHHEGEFAIVEVKDTGCGIPESLRTRIFDPFFTTKEVGKGTGQGLTFCHDVIVNQHHGLIELDSTPGVGTCFRVKLPRTATAPEQASINA
ncbi:MAG: hypothetical protein IT425_14105, partial [Pirellulales bacterium]|nr:hypothetical protein [Pirellulales bacterium]